MDVGICPLRDLPNPREGKQPHRDAIARVNAPGHECDSHLFSPQPVYSVNRCLWVHCTCAQQAMGLSSLHSARKLDDPVVPSKIAP